MKYFGSRQIAALGLAVFAALFAIIGFGDLGFWDAVNGPGPGFFPGIMAILMLVMCLVVLFQSFRETAAVVYTRDELLIVGCGIGVAVLAFVIGLIPACALFVLWWMKILEKESWKNTLIVLAICMAIAFGVFQEWLGVDFPLGIFEELI